MRLYDHEWSKYGVSLGPINLSHLVFNPAVDFTQLNTWNNPDINKLPWEYPTHTRAQRGRDLWSGRARKDLLKRELGPTWLSAGLQPVKHQGTMIPPHTCTHSAAVYAIWGMGGRGWQPCSGRAAHCAAWPRVCV